MDRSALATAVRDYVGYLGVTRINTTTIYRFIDRGCRRLNKDAKANRGSQTYELYKGREQLMGGTVMEVFRCRIGTGTEREKLDPVSVAGLDSEDGDWESGTAGTPTSYYTDGMYIGFDQKPRTAASYQNAHAYATGVFVHPTAANGYYYKVATAGLSAANHPTWPTTAGSTVTDNTITWKRQGIARAYAWCLKSPSGLSAAGSIPSWCPTHFHDTIAKAAAIDIQGGFDSEEAASDMRMQKLYQEYVKEATELRSLAEGRGQDFTGRMRPTGYGTFRRI